MRAILIWVRGSFRVFISLTFSIDDFFNDSIEDDAGRDIYHHTLQFPERRALDEDMRVRDHHNSNNSMLPVSRDAGGYHSDGNLIEGNIGNGPREVWVIKCRVRTFYALPTTV